MTTLNDSARKAAWRMLETRNDGRNGTRQVRRCWSVRPSQGVRIQVRHPQFGWLDRGRLIPSGVEGHSIRWQPVTPDHEWLDAVVGDYITAERALLAATDELDEPVPADELTA